MTRRRALDWVLIVLLTPPGAGCLRVPWPTACGRSAEGLPIGGRLAAQRGRRVPDGEAELWERRTRSGRATRSSRSTARACAAAPRFASAISRRAPPRARVHGHLAHSSGRALRSAARPHSPSLWWARTVLASSGARLTGVILLGAHRRVAPRAAQCVGCWCFAMRVAGDPALRPLPGWPRAARCLCTPPTRSAPCSPSGTCRSSRSPLDPSQRCSASSRSRPASCSWLTYLARYFLPSLRITTGR